MYVLYVCYTTILYVYLCFVNSNNIYNYIIYSILYYRTPLILCSFCENEEWKDHEKNMKRTWKEHENGAKKAWKGHESERLY